MLLAGLRRAAVARAAADFDAHSYRSHAEASRGRDG
jgi:hypothetical protein